MILLRDLLTEIQTNQPKAIFLAGSSGSGKTTVINSLKSSLPQISKFEVLNIDDEYENLLKKTIGLKAIEYGPEERSLAAQYMGKAQKVTKEKYQELKQQLKNIIIDGTGASSKPLFKKKEELENLGYKTFMIALYVSPTTSLERNQQRYEEGGRGLIPSIILRTWRDYVKNIDIYRQIFKNNFVLLDREDGVFLGYDESYVKKHFIDKFTFKDLKPKSPKDQAKSDREKQQINRDIEELIKIEQDFDTFDKAKQKLNEFIK